MVKNHHIPQWLIRCLPHPYLHFSKKLSWDFTFGSIKSQPPPKFYFLMENFENIWDFKYDYIKSPLPIRLSHSKLNKFGTSDLATKNHPPNQESNLMGFWNFRYVKPSCPHIRPFSGKLGAFLGTSDLTISNHFPPPRI